MLLLIGAFTIGLILSLLALGVFISFRIFDFPDITADGSITLGAAVTAVLILAGVHPLAALAAAFAAGVVAGTTTGVLHTRFKINGLLSGILVMTALYSVNLHIMGKSNVPLLSERTLVTIAESAALRVLGTSTVQVLGWDVSARDAAVLALAFAVAVAISVAGRCSCAFSRARMNSVSWAATGVTSRVTNNSRRGSLITIETVADREALTNHARVYSTR